jgi:SNF2 family DNA or RNA helicase
MGVMTIAEIKLFPHQVQALSDTEQFDNVAYYLDMGLGKTFVGSERLWEYNTPFNLVICQKSKIADWVQHFRTYYGDDYQTIVYTGQPLDKIPADSVLVINYESAWRKPDLKRLRNFTLMLDESSKIKNESSKVTKFVLGLKPEHVILLSGTPTGGKYEELWSQCRLLGWNINKYKFLARYTNRVWNPIFSCFEIHGYKHIDELKRELRKHGAVFTKTDEVFDLPAKNHITVDVKATRDYKTFAADHYLVRNGEELIGDTSMGAKLILRKLAGIWNANKLRAFNELLESTADRLIVFYNFKVEYDELAKIVHKHKRPLSTMNGSLKDMTAYEQAGNSVTLVQYQSGAMGLNLQKANKIVYFTLTDKSELFEQSKKRIHRIGQERPCFYYYLMTKGSIEPKMLATLKMRRDYTDKLFEKEEMT